MEVTVANPTVVTTTVETTAFPFVELTVDAGKKHVSCVVEITLTPVADTPSTLTLVSPLVKLVPTPLIV